MKQNLSPFQGGDPTVFEFVDASSKLIINVCLLECGLPTAIYTKAPNPLCLGKKWWHRSLLVEKCNGTAFLLGALLEWLSFSSIVLLQKTGRPDLLFPSKAKRLRIILFCLNGELHKCPLAREKQAENKQGWARLAQSTKWEARSAWKQLYVWHH